MRYAKLIEYINNENSKNKDMIEKNDIYKFYIEIYKNKNIRSFENVISYLKSNNIISEIKKDKYIIVTKKIFKYKETDEEKIIYDMIKKEYSQINFIVWNTKVINEFTLHYVINNYILIEVEKLVIDLIVNLLKEKYFKKYTIITQDIFNNNRDLFLNTEKIIIVKPLHSRSPLNTNNSEKYISIEKMMVDLYVDKLYIQYQGNELKTIYQNVFEKYDINMKKIIKYAKYRTDLELYQKYIESLDIPEKYKLKEE